MFGVLTFAAALGRPRAARNVKHLKPVIEFYIIARKKELIMGMENCGQLCVDHKHFCNISGGGGSNTFFQRYWGRGRGYFAHQLLMYPPHTHGNK